MSRGQQFVRQFESWKLENLIQLEISWRQILPDTEEQQTVLAAMREELQALIHRKSPEHSTV